jgi:hypothetical protein
MVAAAPSTPLCNAAVSPDPFCSVGNRPLNVAYAMLVPVLNLSGQHLNQAPHHP